MTTLAIHRESPETQAIALPEPRGGAISIRAAMASDIKFIDELQRKHAKMVGWFPTKQLETNIERGQVLIAECQLAPSDSLGAKCPVGYVIAHDKYLKREELGIVYQLNVAPGKQRGLIGASLIKAVFDRAAYGCKLFCCWCAQDLEANHFWESIGFVPLAFRTGSRERRKKSGEVTREARTHIFWQRRIREGDTETPYWFPSETTGGALRENRLVLPIPPSTHWSDARPAILPGMENVNTLQLEGETETKPRKRPRPPKRKPKAAPVIRPRRGLWFAAPQPEPTPAEKKAAKAAEPKPPRPRFKNDPKHIAAARELRDRYLEQVNTSLDRMLPSARGGGKYDVSRQLETASTTLHQVPLLKAA